MKLPLKFRIAVTVAITLLIWSHIAWDYFHGGIPTHYILQDPDLPGIPNWLGGIVLPFFTWYLLYRINKRMDDPESEEKFNMGFVRFFLALLVSVMIAVCFMMGIGVIDYMMLGLFIFAFFFPLYKSEYLLGYVIGASFSFGAIIPIVFGSILALIFFIIHIISKALVRWVRPKRK